jgi:hypothetical protein
MSTQFVQIKALGSKLAPLEGFIDFPYMNKIKTLKNILLKQNRQQEL